MPNLVMKGNAIVLSMDDQSEFAKNYRTKLFFSSILGMKYDGSTCYIFDEPASFIQIAKLIQEIIEYLEKNQIKLILDKKLNKILEALEISEKQLIESQKKGKEILSASFDSLDVPGFTRILKPYQIKPVIHAVDCLFVANFSVPGSGKTTMAYATYAILRKKSIVEKLIVIGPRASFMPWEEEFESCFNKEPKSFRIVNSNSLDLLENVADSDLVLLTYNMASNITDQLCEILSQFDCLVILDESHYIKRFTGGLWSESVLKIAPFAKRRLILTGTPMPNSLLDLWSQFTFLWPFRHLLGERLSYKWDTEEPNSLENVRERLLPFYTRVTKSQLNLPQVSFDEIYVPMKRVQQSIYDTLAVRILAELVASPNDRMKIRDFRRAKIIRLLQAASNPSLLSEYSEEFRIPPLTTDGFSVVNLIERYSEFEIPSKLIKTERLVRDLLSKGEKVIVWETFIHNIKTLQNMLQDLDPILIYGDIPRDENENEFVNREKLIREFKKDPNARVLIANPNSLAESVSLHKICRHAIYVDRTFNGGQYIQSLDRIHRIGLKKDDKVTYHVLISKNTIDETIDGRLKDKYQAMLEILNDDLSVTDFDVSMEEINAQEFEKDFKAVQNHLLMLKNGRI